MTVGRSAAGTIALALLGGAAPLPQERVVTGDGIVAVTINGKAGRLRIDPGAPGVPLVSADFAARAGLKSGMFGFGLGYGVGPYTAYHSSTVAKLDLGVGVFKRRVGWGKRAYSTVADGTIGPANLPEPVVRFVLREPRPGERTVSLPMVYEGGLLFGGLFDVYAQITVGGQPLRVRFDPYHARTLANAGAALRIAAAHDGRLSGDTAPVEIAFGIERPVRTMTLARPLAVGPLSITVLGARTVDGGNATRIAEGPPPAVDPEEVVVVAKGKKRDPNRDRLSIGADQLDRCSSLVFDKPAKQIRLTCV